MAAATTTPPNVDQACNIPFIYSCIGYTIFYRQLSQPQHAYLFDSSTQFWCPSVYREQQSQEREDCRMSAEPKERKNSIGLWQWPAIRVSNVDTFVAGLDVSPY